MKSKEIASDAAIGVLIGFALSGLFYFVWGAFELVGFFLWSIVAGGGGALIGRRVLHTRVAVVLGAVVVRVAIFALFGEF
ncbi:MAG: hypothetical protein ACQETQ_02710 [Spirochaetota bacterium]